MTILLAGDIGGTSARLAYFEQANGRLRPLVEEVKRSHEYPSLQAAVLEFKNKHKYEVACACFGVAGPVNEGRVEAPNLPWVIEAKVLERELGLSKVYLINDLEANAHGLTELSEEDFAVLAPGAVGAKGNGAVISAGTGLGEGRVAFEHRYPDWGLHVGEVDKGFDTVTAYYVKLRLI